MGHILVFIFLGLLGLPQAVPLVVEGLFLLAKKAHRNLHYIVEIYSRTFYIVEPLLYSRNFQPSHFKGSALSQGFKYSGIKEAPPVLGSFSLHLSAHSLYALQG